VPKVLKSGGLNLLEPSGPVQACNGIALPVYIILYYIILYYIILYYIILYYIILYYIIVHAGDKFIEFVNLGFHLTYYLFNSGLL